MLITERSVSNTHSAGSSRTAQPPKPERTAQPALERKAVLANVSKLMSKAGDRQSWLLLALVMLPVIGMIHNFMTYGFER